MLKYQHFFLHGKQIAFQITVAQALMWWVLQMKGTSWVWAECPACSPPAATTRRAGCELQRPLAKSRSSESRPTKALHSPAPSTTTKSTGLLQKLPFKWGERQGPPHGPVTPGWAPAVEAPQRRAALSRRETHLHRLLPLPNPQTQQRTKLVLGCSSVTGLLLLVMHEPQHPPFTVQLPVDSPARSLKASSHLWTRSVMPGSRGTLIFKQSWSG